MTKLEFMKELESLLLDIPLEERDEALRYYNGYFEDAGEDHEQEIIAELGSPKKVADIIKADLNLNAVERESRGYFTENGYKDTIDNKEQLEVVGAIKQESDNSDTAKRAGTTGAYSSQNTNGYNQRTNQGTYQSANQGANQSTNQGANHSTGGAYSNGSQANHNTKNSNAGLIVLIGIFTFPIWLPILCTIFGLAIGLVATIIGLIFGFGVAGIALICAGIALFIAGLIQLSVPLVGIALCGCGLIILGLGMLLTLACVALCRTVLPAMVKGFVGLCRIPFKNRSVMA